MALARVMHLAGSYWGFVLMSLHLGLHWSMISGMLRKLTGGRKCPALQWVIRIFGILIAAYGAYCFVNADIFSYMFLKTEFVFFDFEKSAVSVFSEYIAMMGLWIWLGYYAEKILKKLSNKKTNRKENSHEKN